MCHSQIPTGCPTPSLPPYPLLPALKLINSSARQGFQEQKLTTCSLGALEFLSRLLFFLSILLIFLAAHSTLDSNEDISLLIYLILINSG